MFDFTSLLWIGFGASSLMVAFAAYAAAYWKCLEVKEA
jgi:hypothetical protein